MAANEKYSYRGYSYHGLSFKDRPSSEFNNSEIVGSCFYQEWVDDGDTMKDIFPVGMTGVTFVRCNLDNVFVPPGNIVDASCTHKRIRVQNDMEDWIVDINDKPVEPVHPKRYDDLGLSKDPKDIPKNFIRREKLLQDDYNKLKITNDFTQWWKQSPTIVATEQVELDGVKKTAVTIEGPGYFLLSGKKCRSCSRRPLTTEKLLELKAQG